MLFLMTLLLTRRLSINIAENLEERVSGMALYLNWLGRFNRVAFSAKTFAQEVEPVEPARFKPLEQRS